MLLRYSFEMKEEAALIEGACLAALQSGLRTADIMQPGMTRVTTREMGAAVMRELERLAA